MNPAAAITLLLSIPAVSLVVCGMLYAWIGR